MAKVAKRIQKIREGVDPNKLYVLTDAISMVKERAVAKFDETVEVSMNLGVDPRHADQMVRGVVNLPNGTGRDVRVAVFARGVKADEATAAGADVVGAEELVEIVQGGKIDFDRCIATPDMMPLVGRLGKVLGPRGMMPNPKVGTVTMDVAGAVKASRAALSSSASKRPVSYTLVLARLRSTPRLLKKTSRLSPTPSSRQSRPVPRATTSSASRFPRPWVRASRSNLRRLRLNQFSRFLIGSVTKRISGSGSRKFPGKPGTPVRDCGWPCLSGFGLNHSTCMRRVRLDLRHLWMPDCPVRTWCACA